MARLSPLKFAFWPTGDSCLKILKGLMSTWDRPRVWIAGDDGGEWREMALRRRGLFAELIWGLRKLPFALYFSISVLKKQLREMLCSPMSMWACIRVSVDKTSVVESASAWCRRLQWSLTRLGLWLVRAARHQPSSCRGRGRDRGLRADLARSNRAHSAEEEEDTRARISAEWASLSLTNRTTRSYSNKVRRGHHAVNAITDSSRVNSATFTFLLLIFTHKWSTERRTNITWLLLGNHCQTVLLLRQFRAAECSRNRWKTIVLWCWNQ
jgi:hypothetical protein